MVHFHRPNSSFMVLEALIGWIETIDEEEYYCF